MKYVSALDWLNMPPEGQAIYTPRKLTLREIKAIKREGRMSVRDINAQINEARINALIRERSIKKRVKWAKSQLSKEQRERLKDASDITIIKEGEKRAREKARERERKRWANEQIRKSIKERNKWLRKQREEEDKYRQETPDYGKETPSTSKGDTIRDEYEYDPDTGEYKKRPYESKTHTGLTDPVRMYGNMLNYVGADQDLIDRFNEMMDELNSDQQKQLMSESPDISDLYQAYNAYQTGAIDNKLAKLSALMDKYNKYRNN